VPGDCDRARVQASGNEVRSQFDDPVAYDDGRPLRAAMRPPGPWLERFEATFPIPTDEPVQVAATDAALGCRGGDGQLC
jgi:hypothetical protein